MRMSLKNTVLRGWRSGTDSPEGSQIIFATVVSYRGDRGVENNKTLLERKPQSI